jgi:dethiobiotin synthetase
VGISNSIAIAGIHTGIGKTIASAVIAEAIGADYWKPVQAGSEQRDALQVTQLLTNGVNRVHDEAVILSQPLSPHAAALIDDVDVDYRKFAWPETEKTLLIETAGGVLSPMSAHSTMADFISHFNLPVLLVSMNYLGSINHTLLSIEVLKSRGIKILGVIMNGLENEESESFIRDYGGVPLTARIPFISELNNDSIKRHALQIKPALIKLLQDVGNK